MAEGPETVMVESRSGRPVEPGLRSRAVAAVVEGGMSAPTRRPGLDPGMTLYRFLWRPHGYPNPGMKKEGRACPCGRAR